MSNFFKANKKLLIGAGAVVSVAIAYYYYSHSEQTKTETLKTRPPWNKKWEKFREKKELAPWENTYPNREIKYLSHFNNDAERDTFNIFVPLCGASNDMIHINEYFTKSMNKKKVKIIGLEISKNAIEYFFERKDKLNQQYIVEMNGNIKIYRSKDGVYEFYVQSIFDKDTQKLVTERVKQIGSIDIVYDRAALNCIEPKQRNEYISFLSKLLNDNGGKVLLSTLRFNKEESKKEYLNRSPYSWQTDEVYKGFKEMTNNKKDHIQLLNSMKWSDSEYEDEKSLGRRMGIDPTNGFCDIYCIKKSKI